MPAGEPGGVGRIQLIHGTVLVVDCKSLVRKLGASLISDYEKAHLEGCALGGGPNALSRDEPFIAIVVSGNNVVDGRVASESGDAVRLDLTMASEVREDDVGVMEMEVEDCST